MNDQYPIGTICIGQNFVHCTEYNRMECEIIGALEMRKWRGVHTGRTDLSPCYRVRWADGRETAQSPYQLKRKPGSPKQSDSQWADEAVRKLKKQSSDHVAGGSKHLTPEEA